VCGEGSSVQARRERQAYLAVDRIFVSFRQVGIERQGFSAGALALDMISKLSMVFKAGHRAEKWAPSVTAGQPRIRLGKVWIKLERPLELVNRVGHAPASPGISTNIFIDHTGLAVGGLTIEYNGFDLSLGFFLYQDPPGTFGNVKLDR
jgi:hypothetical protein